MKNSNQLSRPSFVQNFNQSGQALIEYLLILIITVSLILGLATQLFAPFGKFVESYMGDYVGCLLEYGELPTLGFSGTGNDISDCTAIMTKVGGSFKAGTAGGLGGGSGSGGQSGGQSGSISGGQNGTSTNGNGNQGGENSSSSTKNGYAGSASRGGSSVIPFTRPGSTSEANGIELPGDKKKIEITLDNGGGSGFFGSGSSGSSRSSRGQKSTYIAISGMTEEEQKKVEQKVSGGSRTVVVTSAVPTNSKKIQVQKPAEKLKTIEEEKSFTIGNYIRILFIAALIIALVVFIGGQALQMSKNSSD